MLKEDYAISTDSSADFTHEDIKKLGVEVIYLEVSLDGKLYMDKTANTQVDFYMQDGKLYVEEA